MLPVPVPAGDLRSAGGSNEGFDQHAVLLGGGLGDVVLHPRPLSRRQTGGGTADWRNHPATDGTTGRADIDLCCGAAAVQLEDRLMYENMLAALAAKGDRDGALRYQEQLAEIEQRIQAVDYRAANVRVGYVYVISIVGALGKQMVKVGMTRRLDPLDRVRELGDASVPFRFDDSMSTPSSSPRTLSAIEAKMHTCLTDRRVNRVNQRREFFYATPHEVKEHLLALTGDLLQYDEMPEALEYHQSLAQNRTARAAL
jgi:hypothetical protein